MRVAFVSVSDQMGGSEVVLLEILRGVGRLRPRWDLHLIVPGHGSLAHAARAAGANVAVLPMPETLASFGETAAVADRLALPARMLRTMVDLPAYQRAFGATLKRIAPDVIHTNGFKAHVLGARRKPRNSALVWHVHEYVSRRPLTQALLRRYARRTDAVAANSESVASDVRGAIDAARVETILNGVDLVRFSPDGAAVDLDALAGTTPAPAGTVRIGLPATFARWKGHAVFLHALAALPRELPVRGYVIGGAVYDTRGSQYSISELQGLAASLGIADRVGFTGFVKTPAEAMRALDVVVHASTDPEPFGMVIAEAMACGRALITTAHGGAGELVRDGVDALVHRPGDAADLSSAIRTLATDAALRARLAANARAAAVERFDARRMAERFAQLYEEVRPASGPAKAGHHDNQSG
jgi:glycosyltransferase involved in cell wall biosynthesis